MKLIIAGTRTFKITPSDIWDFLVGFGVEGYSVSQVVSGGASGVDASGEDFANIYLSDKKDFLKRFPADWNAYGKAAGPMRNGQMAEYADALLVIWDGESSGSKNMKERMVGMGKPVYEVVLRKYNAAK